jgi:hypothetical protein
MELSELEVFSIEKAVPLIRKHCGQFLIEARGLPLYRGWGESNLDFFVNSPPINRQPRDTKIEFHNLFVRAFKNAGFAANRNNSFHCTGNAELAKQYTESSSIYYVFPLDGYKFTWSPTIIDLYMYLFDFDEFSLSGLLSDPKQTGTVWADDVDEDKLSKFIKDNYQTKNMYKALKSKSEILINGKCFFLKTDYMNTQAVYLANFLI